LTYVPEIPLRLFLPRNPVVKIKPTRKMGEL